MVITSEQDHKIAEQFDIVNKGRAAAGFLEMLGGYLCEHFMSWHAGGWAGRLYVQADRQAYEYIWKGEQPSVSTVAEWAWICGLLPRCENVSVKLTLQGGIDYAVQKRLSDIKMRLDDGSLADFVTFKFYERSDYAEYLSMLGIRKGRFVRYDVDFDDGQDMVSDIDCWFSYNHNLEVRLPETAGPVILRETGTTIRRFAAQFNTTAECYLDKADNGGYSAGIAFGLLINGREELAEYLGYCNELLRLAKQAGGELVLDYVFLPHGSNALAAMKITEECGSIKAKYARL